MTHDEAFLQAILESPDDDTPRLIYADWLDEHGDSARAELIRVQCQLAEMGLDDPRWPGLLIREEQLVAEHADEWLGDLRQRVVGWRFDRGFLTRIVVPLPDYLRQPRMKPPPTVRQVVVDLKDVVIAAEAIRQVPEPIACIYIILPLWMSIDGRLTLAMSDPSDRDMVDHLASLLRCGIEAVMADPDQIRDAIVSHYVPNP
jgi:uncharacterized protein (TIGR02996 family)